MNENIISHFWSKVEKPSNNSCWVWTGSKVLGYGTVSVGNRKNERAHRLAWILMNGKIPDGLDVCHKCPGKSNKACVNPNHLFLGTHKQNMEYASANGEMVRGEKHSRSKLTESDVKSMREIYSLGNISYEKIAKMFGITVGPAFFAINRKTWKHVK